MRFSIATSALIATLALGLSACGGSGSADSSPTPGAPLRVVAGFYPLAYAAEQVGGDAVEVINLTPPGGEAHDLELSPQQVAEIGEADLVLYIPGFQPALDQAIEQVAADRALNVTEALSLLPAEDHAHEGETGTSDAHSALDGDPHVWLNPLNMAAIGDEIAARLSALDADGPFAAGAQTLTGSMNSLNDEWATGTAECRSRDLVVSHEAFGYLAEQYDFAQIGIAGLSPDAEPSPARIAEVADLVRERGVTTIYYETLVDPGVAQTLAAETGATTAILDPLEGLLEGSAGNYVTVMQANLEQVRSGQGCA
ncbi:MAG: metal ABC transporter substrate-binding protein [Candidatus Nanopelagicales bacterium]